MYNLYFSDSFELDILMMNYLKAENINYIYRNDCFLMKDETFHKIDENLSEGTLVHNFTYQDIETNYYNIIYNPRPQYQKVSHLKKSYKKIDTPPIKRFHLPDNLVIYNESMICDYYSFNLISNPYTLIFSLLRNINTRTVFSSIAINYYLCKKEIILFFIFQFPISNEKTIIQHIDCFKKKILFSTDSIRNEKHFIPDNEQNWEQMFLSGNWPFTESKLNLKHLGRRKFYPMANDVIN